MRYASVKFGGLSNMLLLTIHKEAKSPSKIPTIIVSHSKVCAIWMQQKQKQGVRVYTGDARPSSALAFPLPTPYPCTGAATPPPRAQARPANAAGSRSRPVRKHRVPVVRPRVPIPVPRPRRGSRDRVRAREGERDGVAGGGYEGRPRVTVGGRMVHGRVRVPMACGGRHGSDSTPTPTPPRLCPQSRWPWSPSHPESRVATTSPRVMPYQGAALLHGRGYGYGYGTAARLYSAAPAPTSKRRNSSPTIAARSVVCLAPGEEPERAPAPAEAEDGGRGGGGGGDEGRGAYAVGREVAGELVLLFFSLRRNVEGAAGVVFGVGVVIGLCVGVSLFTIHGGGGSALSASASASAASAAKATRAHGGLRG
ncbi:hypothetical protein B0H13DRAFT_2436822 [Mycena leptocephala]|nr:hypothetical protein B0H13DRAFT_2436822 [Mycena leptocephala]